METLYTRRPDINNDHVCFETTIDTEMTADPKTIAEFWCNCKYLWLKEVHGLSALMMSNSRETKTLWFAVITICCVVSIIFMNSSMREFKRNEFSTRIKVYPAKQLKFPTLVFCPKYGDALHVEPLLQDMRLRMGDVSDEVGFEVLRYLIAGSGIDNVNVEKWTDENKFDLDTLFKKWRGNRTQGEMFDFVFDKNGYNCTEMFSECYEGSSTLDCCKIFEPTFVMMRGRLACITLTLLHNEFKEKLIFYYGCYRLVDDYYQRDVDETFKLSLFFRKIQGTLLGNNTRPQLIVYISDSHQEVGFYPRLYLNFNDWNRLHFSQRKIAMIPEHNSCSVDPRNQGKSTCFVYNWMNRVFVDSLNCTSPPFKTMLPYLATVPTCEPEIIVQNYKNVTSTIGDDYGCLPACQRTENRWRLTSSMDLSPVKQHAFRVEASFSELEYEEYTEIRLTTSVQLLSELGGQIGLFLGTSVMTFVQILLGISVLLYRKAKKVYLENVNIALTLRP